MKNKPKYSKQVEDYFQNLILGVSLNNQGMMMQLNQDELSKEQMWEICNSQVEYVKALYELKDGLIDKLKEGEDFTDKMIETINETLNENL